jgi:lipopolysaccharide biosynthesis glycosyltransferase
LDKVVYLDADTIVLQNIDDLFDRPAFAAAPDFFLPDRFNSGVMVLRPAAETFAELIRSLFEHESYDGGDQGFLNAYMPDWYSWPAGHRLPAGYNMQHFIYQFLRGHKATAAQIEHEVKIVHYSVQKPWLAKTTLTGGSEAWWNMYFGAHPERGAGWKRKVHSAEDWSFDRLVQALIG